MENKPYRIRFTPLAADDLDEIDSYISDTLHSPDAAEQLLDKIEISINRLKDFSLSGSEVGDAYLASKGYRKLVVDNYLIFHLVNKASQEVLIMRVQYGAREYRSLL